MLINVETRYGRERGLFKTQLNSRELPSLNELSWLMQGFLSLDSAQGLHNGLLSPTSCISAVLLHNEHACVEVRDQLSQ